MESNAIRVTSRPRWSLPCVDGEDGTQIYSIRCSGVP